MRSRNPYEGVGEDAADLAGPGERSLRAMMVYGAIIPLALLYVGFDAWRTEFTSLLWTDVELQGEAAKAMGVAYAAVGVGMNGRSLWGALGYCGVQKVMMIVAGVGFVAGVFLAMVYGMGGV